MTRLALSALMAAVVVSGICAQEVKDRRENQQDRIANGVENGQLTAGETANLEHKEAGLNQEIRNDRAANGGNLTDNEKARINRQQNRLSNRIYDDKHNAATQHYGSNEVGARRENQQARIAQGIKSGQLTAGETAKLEGQESRINREVRNDRMANGGNLTNKQKAQINRQQNRESARIYNKKHNGATGPR